MRKIVLLNLALLLVLPLCMPIASAEEELDWKKSIDQLAMKRAGIKGKVPLSEKLVNRYQQKVKDEIIKTFTNGVKSNDSNSALFDTLKSTINNRGDLDKLTKAMAEGKGEEFSQTLATLVGKAVLAEKDALPPGLKDDDPRMQAFKNLENALGGTNAVATLSQAAGKTAGGQPVDLEMARAAALNLPFVKGIHDNVKEAAWLERQVYNDAILDPTIDKVYAQWKKDPQTDMHDILQETKSSVFGGSAGALGTLARRDGWAKDDSTRARKLEEIFKERRALEEKAEGEARKLSGYLKEIQRMENDGNSILLDKPPAAGKARDDAMVKALNSYQQIRTRIRKSVLGEIGITDDEYFKYDPFGEDMAQLTRQNYRVRKDNYKDPYFRERFKKMREEILDKLKKEFVQGGDVNIEAMVNEFMQPIMKDAFKNMDVKIK